MILPTLLLLLGVLTLITCEPGSSRTSTLLSDIKAKASANRERIKAKNAQILSRIRESSSSSSSRRNRYQRGIFEEFGEDILPEFRPFHESTQKFYIVGNGPMFTPYSHDQTVPEGARDADPHFHSHHHSHFHHADKFHKGPIPIVHPAKVIVPQININVNQNQQISSSMDGKTFPVHGISEHHHSSAHVHGIPHHPYMPLPGHGSIIDPHFKSHGSMITQTQMVGVAQDTGRKFDSAPAPQNSFQQDHSKDDSDFLNKDQHDGQKQTLRNNEESISDFGHNFNDWNGQIEDALPSEPIVGSPYIFNFPNNHFSEETRRRYKRSLASDLLLQKLQSKKNRFVDDSKSTNTVKRSLPLLRLVTDHNVKLDVPKTMENLGAATKRTFEDNKAPMYHLNRMLGSSKNAFLSALKVPPHNLIIPSDYEIVKSSERVGDINPGIRGRLQDEEITDEDQFDNTFVRLGNILRNSIKSGQDTASYLNDMASDLRNMLHTARYSTPRLIVPYARVPAVQNTLLKSLKLNPRLADVADQQNTVRLGHIMDAVGLSKPSSKSNLDKIVGQSKLKYLRPKDKLAKLYNRLNADVDNDLDTVGEAVDILQDAKLSTGARSLRDFLVKMKNEISSIVKGEPTDHHNLRLKPKSKKKSIQDKEVGKFIETLFDRSDMDSMGSVGTHPGHNEDKDNIHLTRRKSQDDKRKAYTLTVDEDVLGSMFRYLQEDSRLRQAQENNALPRNSSEVEQVLGAINPILFERMANESLVIKTETPTDPNKEPAIQLKNNTDTVGAKMILADPLLKPFMGQLSPEAINEFLSTYNKPEKNVVDGC